MPITLFTSMPNHSAVAPLSPIGTQPMTYTTSTPTALSNDNNSSATDVVTAAANQLLSAGLPPALAQLVAPGISPNYSNNPAVWAAAAAAAAAAALLPTVSAPTSSGAVTSTNLVTTSANSNDVVPSPISPSSASTSSMRITSTPAPIKTAPLDSTGAPKVAITRLPPRSGASTSAATAPPSPPPAPVNPTSRQRKKSAHNAIERRYRTNLNDRIAELRAVVPALSHLSPDEATTAARKSTQDGGADEDDHSCIVDGVAAATRLNKATILRKATEYIVHLRNNNQTLRSEQEELRNLLLQLPGGAESLAQWETNRASNGSANSPSNDASLLSINEALTDEVNSTASSVSSLEANGGSSNNVSRTLLAAFAGLCLVYSPSGTLHDTNMSMAASSGDDHGHAFGALSALPGATTLMHGVNSVANAIPHAIAGWILRFTGLFIFIWLLGLMPAILRSVPTTNTSNDKATAATTTHRRTMSAAALRSDCINKLLSDLQQRSTISLIFNGLREIVALGTRLGIGVTWPMSVPSAAQGLSAIAASEAEITALRLVCEQSVVGVEQVGHYGLLATLYAALRLANHSALPSSAPGFGKHTRDPNNAIAIAVAIQSRVPVRLLSDWIVTKHWEHAQRTAATTAAPVVASNTNIGRAGRDDRGDDALWALRNPGVTRFLKQGGWVGMSLSSLANSPSDESDDSQLHSEEDEIRPANTRLPALNTALARLELPCLLAQLDQLYRLLVNNLALKPTNATLTLQFLGVFARLERYTVLDMRRHHEFGQAVMQARWLAICGASIAAFRLGQHTVLERCVQGMNQLRANSKTIDNDRAFRHVWLTVCAVYAISTNNISTAYYLIMQPLGLQ
ncbi:hypothetical protein BDF22DRAFT_208774 [Syncephalis plumigaleata]|nr:hypothetical protein BDF22DRAFT_208774 [Syncephalis plumigaleata]